MRDVSVVFVCCQRPNLTELCLRKFNETCGDSIDEIVVAYDGDDPEYIEMLHDAAPIDEVLSGERLTRYDRDQRIDEAYARCSNDVYLHLQNDYYIGEDVVPAALDALDHTDFVRFEYIPHQHITKKATIVGESTELYHRNEYGYFFYNDNPHIRATDFPHDGSLDYDADRREPEMSRMWSNAGKESADLYNKNVRHLGIYACGGAEREQYFSRFTLDVHTESLEDPLAVFKTFEQDPHYRELFEKYIDRKT